MKTALVLTAALLGGVVLPTAIFACETKPIANSNATQRVDVTCALSTYEGGDDVVLTVLRGLADAE